MDAWIIGADAVAVTYDLIDLSPEEIGVGLSEALAEQIGAVKMEASRRILLVAPEWMQRNLTARACEELALRFPATAGTALPEPERSEYLAGQAVWDQIRAIRSASNEIEVGLVAVAAQTGGYGGRRAGRICRSGVADIMSNQSARYRSPNCR
jgi:hypothetical protein